MSHLAHGGTAQGASCHSRCHRTAAPPCGRLVRPRIMHENEHKFALSNPSKPHTNFDSLKKSMQKVHKSQQEADGFEKPLLSHSPRERP